MTNSNEKEADRIAGRLLTYLRNELKSSNIEYSSPLTQILGGFDTAVYQFQLKGVQKELNRRLVLRLFPENRGPQNASSEFIVQNLIANEGYPVARGHLLCTDKSVLGGVFFIMDFLPGEPMMNAPLETVPEILGKSHAAVHRIDPGPLIKLLEEQGFDSNSFKLNKKLLNIKKTTNEMPWIYEAVDWLVENLPPEPERPAICHGDFHPQNVLIQNGKVTGVLDWPDFCIADPAFDVANTMWLLTMPFKHLAPTLRPDFVSVDWEMFSQRYLEAYRGRWSLDSTNMDYYRVFRSIKALRDGFHGQQVFRDRSIAEDLINDIYNVTNILITVPEIHERH